MYTLLVSGLPESWEGGAFDLEHSRCLREYTDDALVATYGKLEDTALRHLRRFHSIFAYESSCKKDPLFGRIKDVKKRQRDFRIEYTIDKLSPFLSWQQLEEMSGRLDILKLELYRTHWALKEVDLVQELVTVGVSLPPWAKDGPYSSVDLETHGFDVGLSFPGEARSYVEAVAQVLDRSLGPDAYFYDSNYTAQLARPNLDTLLQGLYKTRCKLVVVFLCEKYQEKR